MKNKFNLTVILFLLLTGSTLAQRSTDRYDREKLQAARVAFITTRLDLSPEQAQKFWPIFNQYNEVRENHLREMSQLNRVRDLDLSEAEAKERLNKRFEIQQKMLADEQAFVKEASSAITYNQILILNGIGREFARQIYSRQRRNDNK